MKEAKNAQAALAALDEAAILSLFVELEVAGKADVGGYCITAGMVSLKKTPKQGVAIKKVRRRRIHHLSTAYPPRV